MGSEIFTKFSIESLLAVVLSKIVNVYNEIKFPSVVRMHCVRCALKNFLLLV